MEKSRWYDWGLEVSVWVIVGLVPLVFWSEFFLSYELAKLVVFRFDLYVGLGFWFVKILNEGGITLPVSFKNKWILLLVGLVLIVLLFHGWLGLIPNVNFWGSYFRQQGVFSYIHYILFGFVVMTGLRWEQIRRILLVAVGALFLTLIYGIAQTFGFIIGQWNIDSFLGRVFSSFGHPNYFGSYLVLMFSPVLAGSLIFADKCSLMNPILFASESTKCLIASCIPYDSSISITSKSDIPGSDSIKTIGLFRYCLILLYSLLNLSTL